MTVVSPVTVLPRAGDEASGSERRMAGDVLNALLSPVSADSRFGRFVLSRRGLATGGGLAALAGLLSAADEFNNPDPTRSSLQNAAAGVGAGVGTVGGALAGGAAGRMIGGMAGAPLGPLGVIVGSTLGGLVGGEALKGLANAVTGVIEGSPEDQALNRARRQAELALELDKRRAQEMLPIQAAAARLAQDLRSKDQLNANLAAILQQAGAAGAAQQVAMTQGLLGGLS